MACRSQRDDADGVAAPGEDERNMAPLEETDSDFAMLRTDKARGFNEAAALKDQVGIQEIHAVLLEIRDPLGLIPLKIRSSYRFSQRRLHAAP